MDERTWTNRTPSPGDRIEGAGIAVGCAAPGGALMISGDLSAALATLVPGAQLIGLGASVPEGPFALCIARDRALIVTEAPLAPTPGWHGSYAATPADDLYLCLTLEGTEAGTVVAAGTGTPLDASSPSAMALFAGMPCLVARGNGGFLIWVQRPEAAYLWSFIARCLKVPAQ